MSQCLAGPTDIKKKVNTRRLWLDLANKLFHLFGSFSLTREQKANGISYHHYYSPVPSGGLQ
jgi:hypothetical protein